MPAPYRGMYTEIHRAAIMQICHCSWNVNNPTFVPILHRIASYYSNIPRFNEQNLILQPSSDDPLTDSPGAYNLVIQWSNISQIVFTKYSEDTIQNGLFARCWETVHASQITFELSWKMSRYLLVNGFGRGEQAIPDVISLLFFKYWFKTSVPITVIQMLEI